MNDDIRAFVVRELGLETLSKEEQDEAVSKIGRALSEKVAIVFLEKLPEEKRETYARVVEGGNQKEIADFLKNNIPDSENVIKETLQKSIEEFKDIRDKLKT